MNNFKSFVSIELQTKIYNLVELSTDSYDGSISGIGRASESGEDTLDF